MCDVSGNKKRRILIVDDNQAIHDDFRKILEVDNREFNLDDVESVLFGESKAARFDVAYEIDDAFQVQVGLEMVTRSLDEDRPYDLAFIDMRMPPGWDGIETIEKLWKVDPELHVVICTAYSNHSWYDIIGRLGRNDKLLVLKKPFDNIEALQLVAALTEKRRFLDECRRYTRQLEERIRQKTIDLHRAHQETIHRLVHASMYRDKETGAHIRRVGLFSAVLAEAAGWSTKDVEQIRMAAPMHDVGKIGIPDSILRKPGPLTADEREIMKTHTVIGAELIADSDSPMLQLASEIALYHHERWDGSGYPTGRSGNDIPQAARIVAVVDVYDALTCDRVYRPAFPKDQVLTTLDEGSGTQFDAELLNLLFERLVEIEALAREHRDSAVPSGPSIDNPGANEFAIQRAVREPKL